MYSYQEAKIANPESEIVTTGENWEFEPTLEGKFERFVENGIEPHVLGDCAWVKCNPADHCMTVEQFLKDGHKFVTGDVVTNLNGSVSNVLPKESCRGWDSVLEYINQADSDDDERYVLRAVALEAANQESENTGKSKPSQTQLLKQMYDFHITLLSLSDEELTIFKGNNRHLIDKLIEELK